MHLRERWISTTFNFGLWLPPVLMGLLLIIASRFNFLTSHNLAEFFAIVISFVMFAFVWVTRDFRKNNFLLFLASGYLWVGLLDLIHTIVFEGMHVIVVGNGNLSAQFWIAARLLQAFVLLIAPFHIKHLRGGPYFFPCLG